LELFIQSVNDLLKENFGSDFNNDNVNILDPFTGTGTFITRLISSGLIDDKNLEKKYKNNIHANEIVLLAYYIASINIESIYYEIKKNDNYEPFNGMVLTDTFQLFEQEKDMIANLLPDNSSRRTRQKNHPVNVVMSNPPYSTGQKSANDNAQNIAYPNLDSLISKTYAADSSATNRNSLYDNYIRAFRWATERIGAEGIVAFVTGAGWIDSSSADGFRKNLVRDFNKIYVFHLRGNQRTSGERSRREGGKIFGSGSRSPIAITFLIKTQNGNKGEINYYDIGDYHSRDKKLELISEFKSIINLPLEKISPDDKNDWINQVDQSFLNFPSLANKQNPDESLFIKSGPGVATNRDLWAYNFDPSKAKESFEILANNYNDLLQQNGSHDERIKKSGSRINWSRGLKNRFKKDKKITFASAKSLKVFYRPFCPHYVFFEKDLIESPGIFPNLYEIKNNLTISITGVGSNKPFSALMCNSINDNHFLSTSANFPLFTNNEKKNDLFDTSAKEYGISDYALNLVKKNFPDSVITKEDIFFYIYAVLHSDDYRKRFSNNLVKELPRIPFVKNYEDFYLFITKGRELSELHINYDNLKAYPVQFKEGDLRLATIDNPMKFFHVTKMKFADSEKRTIIYNSNLTIENIPIEVYEYTVNGKSAIEWVIDRFQISENSDSGIKNDPNDYANNVINDPKYPLLHLQRIITLSLETLKIVKSLPKLNL